MGKSDSFLYQEQEQKKLTPNTFDELLETPLILVIEPLQFLKVEQTINHIGLTDYQESILQQLNTLSLLLRSIVFLPSLAVEPTQEKGGQLVKVEGENYLCYEDKTIAFWSELQDQDKSRQIKEIYLYLRRFQVETDLLPQEDSIQEVHLDTNMILQKAIRCDKNLITVKQHPVLASLIEKQANGTLYRHTVQGMVAGVMGIAVFALWLGINSLDLFLEHNPWNAPKSIHSFTEEERQKLHGFQHYLSFKADKKDFNIEDLKVFLQQFPGRMVVVDLVWEQGKATAFIVMNPSYVVEKKEILHWATQNIPHCKIEESNQHEHQFSIEFDGCNQ